MKREDIAKVFEGATDEQISALLNINSADIGRAKEKIEAERDNYKSQLETAQTALKDFEGVDVKELKGKIDTLTADLTAKETDYQNKLADMEFSSKLEGLITSSGAKNAKAVKALLDIESLKSSKNRDADLKAALEACQKENDFLFGSAEPFQNPVAGTGTPPPAADPLASVRAAMGLPTQTK